MMWQKNVVTAELTSTTENNWNTFLQAMLETIPPVARQGSLLEIMQTTLPSSQPYTVT